MEEQKTNIEPKPPQVKPEVPATVRPTKKQRELLVFIDEFIKEHGYSPSYREIMNGLNYTSVATVALHVGNLIRRGHVRKRDHSARSLEIVVPLTDEPSKIKSNQITAGQEKWLLEKIDYLFSQAESEAIATPQVIQNLTTLIESLKLLGIEAGSQQFTQRLQALTTTEDTRVDK
jgi:SOS-response transcriptional repressor LexA